MTAPELFHAGLSAKADRPLSVDELERFRNEGHYQTREEIQEALVSLLPHLRDEVIQIERTEICEPGNSRLTVFRNPADETSSCYALVSRKGEVSIGRTDDLVPCSRLWLAEFDPIREELLSISTTRQLRFEGQELDLLVIVRRLESKNGDPTPSFAYRGTIRFDDRGMPSLSAFNDHSQPTKGHQWNRSAAERLPEYLKSNKVQVATDLDPLSPDAPSLVDNLIQKTAEKDLEVGVNTIALSSGSCCGSFAGNLLLYSNGLPVIDNDFGESITYLSTAGCCSSETENGSNREGEKTFGLFGSDSRRLGAFEVSWPGFEPTQTTGKQLKRSWRHYLAEFPAATAFLPGSGSDWPDFLVAFRNGDLARLRYIGQRAIADLWSELWKRFDRLEGISRMQQALELDEAGPSNWKRTLMFAAVEEALHQLDSVSSIDLDRHRSDVASLFRKAEDYRVLSVPLQPLFQSLRREVENHTKNDSDSGSLESTEATRFLVSTLAEIYERQDKANVEILTQIDRVIGSLDSKVWEVLASGASAGFMRTRSRRNRQICWSDALRSEVNDSESLAERVAIGLERWASAFLPADAVHIGYWSRKLPLHGSTGLYTDDASDDPSHWLAVASSVGLSVHQVDVDGRITLDPIASLEESGNNQVLPVPGHGGLLLLRDHAGFLKLIGFDPKAAKEKRLEVRAEVSETRTGFPAPFAMIESDDGDCLGVATCQLGRQSEWVLFRVSDGNLETLARQTADLPGVSSIDLAVRKDGDLALIAGSSLGGPVQLYRIRLSRDEAGGEPAFQRVNQYWPSTGGSSSVRFTRDRNPMSFVIGDLEGFLWCGSLEASLHESRLSWVYKLDAAVRSILPLELHGEPHILAGSDAGKLALVRCSDALRVWTHRLQSPVRELSLAVSDRQTVVATLRGGWVCTFEHVGSRDEALSQVERDLDELQSRVDSDPLKSVPATEPARALLRVRREDEPRQILEEIKGREHRARVLRYLIQQLDESLYSRCIQALSILTYREMQLLLCYLPGASTICEEAIRGKLNDTSSKRSRPDDSRKAAITGWVALLHRLDRREVTLEELIESRPRSATWYESPWILLETARIFLEAVRRGLPGSDSDRNPKNKDLFAHSLPFIFSFPPKFLESCSEVLPNSEQEHDNFKNCWQIAEHLSEKTPLTFEGSRQMAEALGGDRPESPLTALIGALFALFASWRGLEEEEEPTNEIWQEERGEILDNLRTLIRIINGFPTSELSGLRAIAVRQMKALLPSRPIPDESMPRSERKAWLETARTSLIADPPVLENIPSNRTLWSPIIEGAIAQLHEIAGKILGLEEKHLREELRPYLRLDKAPDVQESYEVHLDLEISPEGKRWLGDVSVRIDGSIGGGFQGPRTPNTHRILHYRQFGPDTENRTVCLRGFLAHGADSIRIETLLQASGYEHRMTWSFEIPPPPRIEMKSRSGPGLFAPVVSSLLREMREVSKPVVLLILDSELGREQLIQRWKESSGGRQVNLDAEFTDFGDGRKYPRRAIDFGLVQETLDSHGKDEQPLIISHCEQVVKRWLGGEAPGTLARTVEWLRERNGHHEYPRLIWVVSSTHAARLRGLELGSIKVIQAYRSGLDSFDPHGRASESRKDDFWEDLVREGSRTVFANERDASRQSIRRTFGQLGGDLYLIACWFVWAQKNPDEARRGLDSFFEQRPAKQRLQAELRSLESLNLLIALIGANSITTLPFSKIEPGMVSAQRYSSTTIRQAPKILQESGEAFDQRSIRGLQSDASPPDRVRIQGIGNHGTYEAEDRRTRLVDLIKRRKRPELVASFRQLAAYGIGTWSQGIYRTTEPYRGRIRALYDRYSHIGLDERDSRVYQEILGPGRSPLETISLQELAEVPAEQMGPVAPGSNLDERKVLKRLAELWGKDAEQADPVAVLRALYSGKSNWRPVWKAEFAEGRWDRALLDLFPEVIGVGVWVDEGPGKRYPIGYHFWLHPDSKIDLPALDRAIDRTIGRRRQADQEKSSDSTGEEPDPTALTEESSWSPRVILTGPGAEQIAPDRARRYAILRSTDYLRAAWEGKMADSLLRQARVQMRLTSISPFTTSGPIPPGSPYFFGRRSERKFIEQHLSTSCFLIIGSRRVGKTSLLNQIRFSASSRPGLIPIFTDVQAAASRSDFLEALKAHLLTLDDSHELRDLASEIESFPHLVQQIRERTGKLPIFLFNEIDGLAFHEIDVVQEWRALHEANQARFVMTGYATVQHFGDPESPFFNWTRGKEYNGQAITLTDLTADAAKELLGMLTGQELGLKWATPEDENKALETILDRSYRIPWVLQVLGQKLVERMEEERRGDLTFDDVDQLLEEDGDIVWRYIDAIDYGRLGSDLRDSALRPGYQLVLYCLTRARYFSPSARAVDDGKFHLRDPLHQELGFTVDEAREIVKDTVAELLSKSKEKEVVEAWFDDLALERALPLLTLTLTLQADPKSSDRFGFLMHILPTELLRRFGRKDPHLDGLIIDTAIKFWTLVQ